MNSTMGSESGVQSVVDCGEELGKELRFTPNEKLRHGAVSERESGLDMYRSGSAPPTVKGSLSAVGGLFSHRDGDVWSVSSNNSNSCSNSSTKRDVAGSEEDYRSDPEYINYYYSCVNLNPRWPRPLLSKEDWRAAHRLNGGVGGGCGVGASVIGGVRDRRKLSRGDDHDSGGGEVFDTHFNTQKGENGGDLRMGRNQWSGDGLIGLPGLGLGSSQKCNAEIIQDDLDHWTSLSSHHSRPRRSVFDENIANGEALVTHEVESADAFRASPTSAAMKGGAYASALDAPSLSRSTTPDLKTISRTPSPRILPVGEGRVNSMDTRSANSPTLFSVASTGPNDTVDIMAALSSLNLSTDHNVYDKNHMKAPLPHGISDNHMRQDFSNFSSDVNDVKQNSHQSAAEPCGFRQHAISIMGKIPFSDMCETIGAASDWNSFQTMANGHFHHRKPVRASSPFNYYRTGSPNSAIPNFSLSGNSVNPALTTLMEGKRVGNNLPLLHENVAASAVGFTPLDHRTLGGGLASETNLMASAAELQNVSRAGNHYVGPASQAPIMDPLLLEYLRSAEYVAQVDPLADLSMDGANSFVDLLALQKAHLGTLLSSRKSESGGPFIGHSGVMKCGYNGNQGLGLGMRYGGSPLSPLLPNSHAAYGNVMRPGERNMCLPSGMSNMAGGVMGGWHSEAAGLIDQCFGSSLLDEFKTNKTKCFELSEIAGHVVEFSADQYGSRLIQQKLEIATTEEKNVVFNEINPQALSLMTDVFGNYVVQKFFEHGSASQIRELADNLTGHVLTLSLQMYGCRVIQKAIEVVDLDQQKKMVSELDGHIMRCVRDQNGNHVVQKCIEGIPEEDIHFIVSTFFDQIASMSTHPYGCRVIQRILEHCHDPKTQRIVMDEIMLSVSMLAQDQYGNYVIQHVLEHGKPNERSAIISKLSRNIVQLSQQKFASNVIEKCLTFGDPVERHTMVNEMLGSTEENDPLQVMMKDQFANYVVQKVLETCEDQQLKLILSRIKTHLTILKKYTYGKHIVARVEKLVVAGERRIGMLAANAAASVA